jgi:hypothetical protein
LAGVVFYLLGMVSIGILRVAGAEQLFSTLTVGRFYMWHLVAWETNVTNNVETDMTPVADSIITIQNTHFLPQNNMQILWAYAGSADMLRARFQSPKFRQTTSPFIRPINGALLPQDLAGIADYYDMPLKINALEELQVLAFQGGGGAEIVYIGAGISDGNNLPAPNGDIYTMRGTGTTTVTAKAWTQCTITWQDTLPTGTYQVVGLSGQSTTGVFCRLIFENQNWRPGALAFATDPLRPPRQFLKGYLGSWGSFHSYRMPNVEFLCNAADTAQEVFLDFVRTG